MPHFSKLVTYHDWRKDRSPGSLLVHDINDGAPWTQQGKPMVQREIDEKTSDVVPNLQTPPPHIVLGGSSHLLSRSK